MHHTAPVCMLLFHTHLEPIQFLRLTLPYLQMILGYPWISCKNPKSDWATGVICEPSKLPLRLPVSVHSDLTGVPKENQHLQTYFSKVKATNCHCIATTTVWLTCLKHQVRVVCTLCLHLREQLRKHTLSPWLRASFIPCPLLLGLDIFLLFARKDKSQRPCVITAVVFQVLVIDVLRDIIN